MARRLRSALVVDDDPALRSGIGAFLRLQGLRVATAGSASEAVAQLRGRPDVMLLDVRLPDGDAFTVLEHAIQTTPGTMRIALSGAASSDDGFRLGQFGVREFLQKPASLDDIWDAIQRAAEEPPDLKPHVQQAVGYGSLRELLAMVRAEAIKYALLISRGNRTDAARILQVTRQAVQQMLRPAKR